MVSLWLSFGVPNSDIHWRPNRAGAPFFSRLSWALDENSPSGRRSLKNNDESPMEIARTQTEVNPSNGPKETTCVSGEVCAANYEVQ
jgi:hypothetical protein